MHGKIMVEYKIKKLLKETVKYKVDNINREAGQRKGQMKAFWPLLQLNQE